MPRTVMRWPSPTGPPCDVRSIETPVMRDIASARLVSGNLPISSAEIASTTPSASRLIAMESSRLRRMPVTMTSSIMASSSAFWACAATGVIPTAPSASAMLLDRGFIASVRFFKVCASRSLGGLYLESTVTLFPAYPILVRQAQKWKRLHQNVSVFCQNKADFWPSSGV